MVELAPRAVLAMVIDPDYQGEMGLLLPHRLRRSLSSVLEIHWDTS